MHNLIPTDVLSVPKYVLLHLARGGKFVPTSKPTSVKRLLHGLPDFKRQLLLCSHFPEPKQHVSKCRLPSTWLPPGKAEIDVYMRLLNDELSGFVPKSCKPNTTWLDKKAQSWLRQHASSVAIIDCDKGLGDALVLRSWLLQQVELQLAQGYVQVKPEEFRKKTTDLKYCADAIVQNFVASGVVSVAERDFLLSKFARESPGIFRILAKVHKQPVGSRPICNLRMSWFAPFSVFLSEHLGPLVTRLSSVIVSTDQLLQQLGALHCKPGMRFVTLDIVNLYPSVDRLHLLSTVVPFLRLHVRAGLCDFLVRVLELVLEACVVSFQGVCYSSDDGIPTGLSVASILANIYLHQFDLYLENVCGERLQFGRRYIDDLLLLSSLKACRLVQVANSWHRSIRFEVSGEDVVPFLDVTLSILPSRSVHWRIFHKPKNLYLYLPANSCHPASAFKSLQLGGAIRCQRRNRLKADVNSSIVFFRRCLRDRGYDLRRFDRLWSQFVARQSTAHVKSRQVRKAFLKMPFNADISARWLSMRLRKFEPLLKIVIPSVQVGTCWGVGLNLFRRRYPSTWKSFDYG